MSPHGDSRDPQRPPSFPLTPVQQRQTLEDGGAAHDKQVTDIQQARASVTEDIS